MENRIPATTIFIKIKNSMLEVKKKNNFWLQFLLFTDFFAIIAVGIFLNDEKEDIRILTRRAEKEDYVARVIGFSQYGKYKLVDVLIGNDTFKIVNTYWIGIAEKVKVGDTIIKHEGDKYLTIVHSGREIGEINFNPDYSKKRLKWLIAEVVLVLIFFGVILVWFIKTVVPIIKREILIPLREVDQHSKQ